MSPNVPAVYDVLGPDKGFAQQRSRLANRSDQAVFLAPYQPIALAIDGRYDISLCYYIFRKYFVFL
jgi:hypothetical protein